jgi:acyl-CoA thioesterase YciA
MTPYLSTSSFFVFSKDLNYGETLFGGKLLAEMDCEAAKVAKSVIYGTEADGVVTACFDRVDFLSPAKKGDLVVMEADLTELGMSSIKISINVWVKKGPNRADWTQICTAGATFVSMKEGRPYPHGKTITQDPETDSI